MAGWHGAPGGLPRPLAAPPPLYIAPRPALAPRPCLFKRYFHSWRVLYRQLKLIIYTGVCWTGGVGTDTELGGHTEPGWGKGTPHSAGHPPFSWASLAVGPALPPQGRAARVTRVAGTGTLGDKAPQTHPPYPKMCRECCPLPYPSPSAASSPAQPYSMALGAGGTWGRRASHPWQPPGRKRGHEQGATYFQNNRCIFIDALNAMTCFLLLRKINIF